mgnify:CR=1 FL=1
MKENVRTLYRKEIEEATPQQIFQAVSYAVKEAIVDDWLATQKTYEKEDPKTVYYMSMEFLMGRALGNNLINMTAYKEVKEALDEMGIDLNVVEDQEPDAALGNGGLGRLAACFLDSLASLGYAAYGCGIRYRYGMFKQKIKDGYQVEVPDNWLKDGNPFEIRRDEYAKEVRFGGTIRVQYNEQTKKEDFIQENYESVLAIPYDMPIVGYGNHVVNTLRIWDAQAITDFKLDAFDRGEYHKAIEQENLAKTIVEVLYPNDNHYAGKELRLKQQYFFVSASLQVMLDKYKKKHKDVRKLYEKVTIQMNDTHPTVAVAELMRLLIDQEGLGWDEAWEVTTKTVAYTNHTIMSEALEKWPIDLFSRLLPRVYQIVEEINRRFLIEVQNKYPNNYEKVKKMAIIFDGQVKMAHLAIVAGYSVNGVAKLHTEILKNQELKDFYEMMPEKFNNKTNGITQRRFLLHGNPLLADWITEQIGDEWITDLPHLAKLKVYVDDPKFQQEFMNIKYQNKLRLAKYIKEHNGIDVDPRSVFDVQVKRLHEYKRQLMNILHVMYLYNQLKDNPNMDIVPRTFIFGAKAAPAYIIAKDIIHMILCLQQIIDKDPEVKPYLNVVMVNNYNVTLAEKLIPACDISEQISLASKEASGTGNMKFMLNGAVTLGTDDGANVEIHELVGDDNIYIFGKDSDTVIKHYEKADYVSKDYYKKSPVIKEAVDFIVSKEVLKVGKKENLERLYNELLNKDWFMTLLDLEDYIKVKDQAFADYEDQQKWKKMMLVNIAKAGFFSSDRTIAEYNRDIWKLK